MIALLERGEVGAIDDENETVRIELCALLVSVFFPVDVMTVVIDNQLHVRERRISAVGVPNRSRRARLVSCGITCQWLHGPHQRRHQHQ